MSPLAPRDGNGPLAEREATLLRGRGIASGFWFNCGLKSAVTATVNFDGTVSLVEGSTDIGGTRTSIAMQLAETLGIAAEDVIPTVADTDGVGYTDVTGGSRVTFATGIAAVEAAKDIQRQMIDRAAMLWDVKPDKVRYEDGAIVGPSGKQLTFQELAAKIHATGGPIVGNGTSSKATQGGAFGTHCVDVEVDPETGKVQILRYTIAQDCGTAIHPSYVEGQMQGGVVQGIGWALNEEYLYDERGDMRNATLSRLPHPHLLRRADDRYDHRRSARPAASVRRPRRGRSADLPAAGRDCQRDLPGHRRADAAPADVAAEGVGGDSQEGLNHRPVDPKLAGAQNERCVCGSLSRTVPLGLARCVPPTVCLPSCGGDLTKPSPHSCRPRRPASHRTASSSCKSTPRWRLTCGRSSTPMTKTRR